MHHEFLLSVKRFFALITLKRLLSAVHDSIQVSLQPAEFSEGLSAHITGEGFMVLLMDF